MRRVEALPSACILAAFLLLTLPLRWLLAAVFAAGGHEICHVLAVRLCGGRIFRIQIGPAGAALETDSLSFPREMLCALAGRRGACFCCFWGNGFRRPPSAARSRESITCFPFTPWTADGPCGASWEWFCRGKRGSGSRCLQEELSARFCWAFLRICLSVFTPGFLWLFCWQCFWAGPLCEK